MGLYFSLLLVLLRRLIVLTLGRDVKHTCLQDFLITRSVETSGDLNGLISLNRRNCFLVGQKTENV